MKADVDLDARVTIGDLNEALRRLRRIPEAYRRGLSVLAEHEPLVRSSTRFFAGKSGKPASRPPAGTDLHLRACLIRSAQHLMLAIRAFHAWEWDTDAWEPSELVYTVEGRVLCDLGGNPQLREADDLHTRLPASLDPPCTQLRAMISPLQSVDWHTADEWDRDVCRAGLERIRRAVGSLQSAGVYAVPGQWACVVCGSVPTVAKNRCGACYGYKRRTGRERPPGLWDRVA